MNFHRTFVPERRLIAALLEYAAHGKSGTYEEISEETGIPMGKSTGKVPAILDYARGMGLIGLEDSGGTSVRRLVLTSFGRSVYLEDRMLGEALTQWIAHFHLCLPDTGATAWYIAFGKGRSVIGSTFTLEQLEDYLVTECGAGNKRTGPLVRTYLDDAALGRASVLSQRGDTVVRNRAPLLDHYALAYAALVLTLMERLFAGSDQVTVTDLNKNTSWFDTCLWGSTEVERALSLMESTGYLSIDRQISPWILEKRSDALQVWARIYDDLA